MRNIARAESGFTLPELLVAAAAGVVVLLALSTIMIVTMHQTQRTFTRIDATRQARGALQTIENELHSSCVSASATPIQAGSSSTQVNFITYTGTAAIPTPTYHQLTIGSGQLTDTSFVAVAGSGGSYTPTGTGTKATLLGNVAAQSGLDPFQFFSYKAYPAPDGNQFWTIPNGTDALPDATVPSSAPTVPASGQTTLSSSQAAGVVELSINLDVRASGQNIANANLAGSSAPVSDSISLRLSTPPDELPAGAGASGEFGPCQ